MDRSVVDKSTTFARGRNLTAEDEVIVVVDIGLSKKRLEGEGRDVKLSLDDTLAVLVGQDCRVGTLAEEESQSTQEDGLAGSRLARDSHKSRPEDDIGLTDESIIFNMEGG